MHKPRIALIGAGKVGSTFGILLRQKGYEISAVTSKTRSHAASLAARVDSIVTDDATTCASSAEVVFVTTPDREIAKVAREVASNKGFRRGQVVIHASGFLPSEALSVAREFGAHVASMHPLQSFADVEAALVALPGSLMAIEGDEEAIQVAKALAMDMDTKPFVISTSAKPLYHAAAVVASNYLVSLIHFSVSIYRGLGLSERDALQALWPLIEGTVKNIRQVGPTQALTGPIARGDSEVVKGHLEALSKVGKENVALYSVLGLYTVRLAEEKGAITRDQAQELREALERMDLHERRFRL
ncbi:MAG: DUF2520 domain-containing protein [Firmicutes bacterium]|nr:DUF2520 domain-containing protein [Bacillota bacterium]